MLRALAVFSIPLLALDAETVRQPVIDYAIPFHSRDHESAPRINAFEHFSHFAGDFGWQGPGQDRLSVRDGQVRVAAGAEWTGGWHSLAGLARESQRTLDPTDLTGLAGPPERRARVTGLLVHATGSGTLKLELTDDVGRSTWTRYVELTTDSPAQHRFDLDASALGRLKLLHWVAEPGSELAISGLTFEVATPDLDPREWLFRLSLGKLRRTVDPATGLARDRAHLPAGEFESVPASAMNALASALASRLGVLESASAAAEVRLATSTILSLPRAAGFLPHFTSHDATGRPTIHPGTEFSTVDTAITFHSLLLASQIVEAHDLTESLRQEIRSLDFAAVTSPEGFIHHGFRDDATTLLPPVWSDWGGETALVLALEKMARGPEARGRMHDTGEVHDGVAFIAEIQSLFFPDFDRATPDALTHVVWPDVRRDLLRRQRGYFPAEVPAAQAGLWGFSAGEAGLPGRGYAAYGVETAGLAWLHPHAMVLCTALSDPDALPDAIAALDRAGFLFPRGLPENISADLARHNPMQGSLNAAFETLAAYHGWKRPSGDNLIDQASVSSPLLRRGAARFFP